METKSRKVVVVGAGAVGTSYIYALLHTALAGEIALIDIDQERVEGEVMDLSHGLPFVSPVSIKRGDYSDYADAQMIVVTAGATQQSGQSRTELTRKNADIVKNICAEIGKHPTNAVLVMVTNPVDALTQLAVDCLKWPRGRIIGSGTVLDTARLKYMLSRHCQIDVRNVHAYVIGEHGDSEVAAWSLAHIAGIPIHEYCKICRQCDYKKHHPEITEQVRDSAYHIIDYKGATFFGIGMSMMRISGAILRNERSVLTVSTMLNGEYDMDQVCMSVPCIVGQAGAEKIIDATLSDEEHRALKQSAEKLIKTYGVINP